MLSRVLEERGFGKELMFKASRSSGPGGQNVNKVSTRMELRFSVNDSHLLDDEEKSKIMAALSGYMNKEGELILVSQSERSQFGNRQKVTERFFKIIHKALAPVKRRKATQPTHSSRIRRIESKKLISEKKALRKLNSDEN